MQLQSFFTIIFIAYVHLNNFFRWPTATEVKKHPIVLFSGLASNSLYTVPPLCVVHREERIWFNFAVYLDFLECWSNHIKLQYFPENNSVSDYIHYSPVYLKDIGHTDTMEQIAEVYNFTDKVEIFAFMVRRIVVAGFEKNKTLFGIPYDWRKAVVDVSVHYFDEVANDIEQAVDMNEGRKATLVCHSNGCINMAALLIKMGKVWSATNINTIITLAAPWAGSVKALKAYLSGDNLGISNVTAERMWKVEKTLTSLVHLFPSPKVWNPYDTIFELKKNNSIVEYSADKIVRILHDSGRSSGILRGRTNITDYFDGLINVTPGIKKHCFYCLSFSTLGKLVYKNYVSDSTLDSITNVYGDGTVPKISLQYCDGKNDTTSYPQSGVDHQSILKSVPVIDFIIEKSISRV